MISNSMPLNVSYPNSESKKESVQESNERPSKNEKSIDSIYSIAGKYDVTSISIDGVISMSNELYKADEMSLLNFATLSLDPRHLGIGSTYLSQQDAQGNYNMIEELKMRIDLGVKVGDEQSTKTNKDILGLLTKLDNLKTGPLDIKA